MVDENAPVSANLRLRGDVIAGLQENLLHGGHSLGMIPQTLATIIEKDAWREWVVPVTGEVKRYDSFEEFVGEPLPDGLKTDVKTLKNLCRDDPAALDAIDRVMVGGRGGDRRSERFKSTNREFDRGETVQNALHALREKRPDLHQQVISGKKKAHTAMREAGLRRKRVSIYVDDPTAAARSIKLAASAEYVRRLIEELQRG